MPEVDIPPPPYVDGGGSASGRVGEKGGDRVQRKSNRYLTRKRPRSRSPSDSPAPPPPESSPNKKPQLQPQIPTTTSISTSTSRSSNQKQKQIRRRTNPNTNPNATTNVTAITTPEQQITIPDTINPTNPKPNSNHDSLFTFRESLFTIHTQLTLLRGEIDVLRDTVAGLFQHEALAVLDTLRNPTPASVRNSGWRSLQTGGTKIKADEIEMGSETEKDPSLGGDSINSETAGWKGGRR
ncbi:hypothetical protein BGX38DRAFT_1201269 [Terfezia claveryi]|nr:hypothetical protein BGX38DRAFT_1201269 [Terfezia claveryi]